jgi:hypothetical protein
MSIVRDLEIYNITGIGNKETIDLNQWIINTFSNLNITKQEDSNILYTRGNTKLVVLNIKDQEMSIDYNSIWFILERQYNIRYMNIKEITKYVMFKYYKVFNYNPIIGELDNISHKYYNYKVFNQ